MSSRIANRASSGCRGVLPKRGRISGLAGSPPCPTVPRLSARRVGQKRATVSTIVRTRSLRPVASSSWTKSIAHVAFAAIASQRSSRSSVLARRFEVLRRSYIPNSSSTRPVLLWFRVQPSRRSCPCKRRAPERTRLRQIFYMRASRSLLGRAGTILDRRALAAERRARAPFRHRPLDLDRLHQLLLPGGPQSFRRTTSGSISRPGLSEATSSLSSAFPSSSAFGGRISGGDMPAHFVRRLSDVACGLAAFRQTSPIGTPAAACFRTRAFWAPENLLAFMSRRSSAGPGS